MKLLIHSKVWEMKSKFIQHFKLPEYSNIDMLQFILRQILFNVYTFNMPTVNVHMKLS